MSLVRSSGMHLSHRFSHGTSTMEKVISNSAFLNFQLHNHRDSSGSPSSNQTS